MKTILITGGTGLLGMRLSYWLKQLNYEVRHLSRKENLSAIYPAYYWDPTKHEIDQKALKDVDGIIHLAGASLADERWTPEVKKRLINSRVESTKTLSIALEKYEQKPAVFVACSAVGFYGSQGSEILTESSPSGTDFMSEICVLWENSNQEIRQQGIRTPIIRVGIVLSSQGGALEQLKKSYPFRVGSYFGNGQQYYAWIHLDDICQIFIKALEDSSMKGIYNGTAPTPISNYALAKAISAAYNQKTLLVPVPNFAAKTLMGEMSSIVLNSTRAIPEALQKINFNFKHPEVVEAIKDILLKQI